MFVQGPSGVLGAGGVVIKLKGRIVPNQLGLIEGNVQNKQISYWSHLPRMTISFSRVQNSMKRFCSITLHNLPSFFYFFLESLLQVS